MKIVYTLFYILMAAFFIFLFFFLVKVSNADETSTWRYGSPGDIRRMNNYNTHRYHDRDRSRCNDRARAAYNDLIFRAASPELYRLTMPNAPSTPNINIQINNNSGD